MKLGPRKDESVLSNRKLTCDQLDDIDAIDADGLLVVRVEVRPVVLPTSLDEHANDDAVKPGYLWHASEDTKAMRLGLPWQ